MLSIKNGKNKFFLRCPKIKKKAGKQDFFPLPGLDFFLWTAKKDALSLHYLLSKILFLPKT